MKKIIFIIATIIMLHSINSQADGIPFFDDSFKITYAASNMMKRIVGEPVNPLIKEYDRNLLALNPGQCSMKYLLESKKNALSSFKLTMMMHDDAMKYFSLAEKLLVNIDTYESETRIIESWDVPAQVYINEIVELYNQNHASDIAKADEVLKQLHDQGKQNTSGYRRLLADRNRIIDTVNNSIQGFKDAEAKKKKIGKFKRTVSLKLINDLKREVADEIKKTGKVDSNDYTTMIRMLSENSDKIAKLQSKFIADYRALLR